MEVVDGSQKYLKNIRAKIELHGRSSLIFILEIRLFIKKIIIGHKAGYY